MKKQSETQIESPFMDLAEASFYLKLKPSTVYSYTHNKVLPYYKLRGRKLYFRKDHLDNFILNEANLVKSIDQIESEAKEILLKEKI